MDVKACDNCKKLNTEVVMYFLTETHKSKHPQLVATKDDPLVGFRFEKYDWGSLVHDFAAGAEVLCMACASQKIAALLGAL